MAARVGELHTHIFFRKRAAETDASRVRANGIVVFVPKFGIEAPIVFEEEGEGAGADEGSSARAKCARRGRETLTTPAGKTWKIFGRPVRVESKSSADVPGSPYASSSDGYTDGSCGSGRSREREARARSTVRAEP